MVEDVIVDTIPDVCNSIVVEECSSFNSPDTEKQEKVQATLVEEVDEQPGGMLLQAIAVQDSGKQMIESLLFSSRISL